MYSFNNPYISRIKDRTLVNKDSSKKAYNITLDIENSNLSFIPGDSIAILPENDPRIVDLTLKAMKADPGTEIINPKNQEKIILIDFLTKKANISKILPSLIKLISHKKENIKDLIKIISTHHVWDFLKLHPNHKIPAQEICNNMLPLLPRLYSAASSLTMYPNEIHLIITHVSYELGDIKRNGVCTEFICHIANILKTPIAIYPQPSHGFVLPKDPNTPIIMIAVGSGIAPFIAFLEEKYLTNPNENNWLFFGARNAKTDFYFENFLKDLVQKNQLRLTTAFSRDQEDNIYVQDRLLEHRSDVWQWINQGAHIYICGYDKMARDIDKTIQKIAMKEGNLSQEQAQQFSKELIRDKRLLKDVY